MDQNHSTSAKIPSGTPTRTARTKTSALNAWKRHHARCLKDGLWHLVRRPLSAWATIFAIAIVLALPGFLMTLAAQIKHIGGAWAAEQGQVNVYLKTGTDETHVKDFTQWLQSQPNVRSTHVIPPEQGLKDLARRLNIDSLDSDIPNPLPTVVVLKLKNPTDQASLALREEIRNNPLVENLSESGVWVKRLQTISQFFDELSWWLMFLFGFTVVSVIGNTLRLELQKRREELALIALIGGTRRYMIRPLLYDGAIMGLLGGLVASGLIYTLLTMLTAPINQFAAEYGTQITVITPMMLTALLGLIGLSLGWLSAQLIGRNFLRHAVSA
ncbi:ABC transporter permease [Halothiobacillus sp.]|uniref:cell division protein FtsX n=1 Tax=Halothiobacillus sp. TaxID=1891311 RepID=UPI002630F814|nr:ABC transporter permease [Halothiobacillus sp.]